MLQFTRIKYAIFFILGNFIFSISYCQELQKISEFSTKDGLSGNTIFAITKDNNGYYWQKTNNGISRWNGRSFFEFITPIDSNASKNLLKDSSTAIFNFYNNYMLLTDANSKIYKTKFDKTLIPLSNSNYTKNILRFNELKKNSENITDSLYLRDLKLAFNYSFIYNTNHTFYFSINQSEILFYEKNKGFKKIILPNDQFLNYFILNNLFVALNYKTGNYIVLNKSEVLHKGSIKNIKQIDEWTDKQQNNSSSFLLRDSILYKFYLTPKNSLTSKKLLILKDYEKYLSYYFDEPSNILMLGTQNNGLEVYRVNQKEIKHIKQPVKTNHVYAQTIINNRIVSNIDIYKKYLQKEYPKWQWYLNSAICPISNTSMLCTTEGITYLFNDTYKKIITRLPTNSNTTDYLQTDSVLYIIRSTLDKYYLKTNKYETSEFSNFPTFGNHLFAIGKTYQPNTIFAVIGDKLQYVNLSTKHIKTLASNITGEVRNIYNDTATSTLFIATKFNGCYIYRNNIITKLPFNFYDKILNCHYVLQDNEGDYWLPTNEGLFVMFKKDFNNYLNKRNLKIPFKKFSKQDGLLSEEFNGGFAGAGLYFKDSMYMGGMEGTVVFHPNMKYKNNTTNYKLLIDYVKIDDSIVSNYANIVIEPNFKQILIRADYPFMQNDNLYIMYRILGSNDTSWQFLQTNGIVEIKNLKANKYVVEFKLNNDSNVVKSIAFTVKPYWYNTWWARFLYTVLVFCIAYLIFNWRWHINNTKTLELINTQRNNLFETIAHDLKSPISSYIGLAEDIKYFIKKRNFEAIDEIGNTMDEKSRNLSLLISNVLNWSRTEKGLVKTNKQILSIINVLNETLPMYLDIANFRNISIINNIPDSAYTKTDKSILSHILRNLIDNAIKFSYNNSNVTLDFKETEKTSIIEITNNILPKQIPNLIEINSIFKGASLAEPHTNGMGLGIAALYSSCKLIEASINVEIIHNSVVFTLTIPA